LRGWTANVILKTGRYAAENVHVRIVL
jgi:hypothetical protein